MDATVYRFGMLTLTRDAEGWFYDGPAGCGPREVRRGGRGPFWRGRVSPQFARELLRRIRAAQRAAAEG